MFFFAGYRVSSCLLRALWLLFTTLSCFALPGFDVNEWIILDTLARPDVPMVMLNGNLDKVRKGAS